MFNNELYEKLEAQFGVARMTDFAEIMITRHDILFADSDDALNGEDFERDWWIDKYVKLKSAPKDGNNNIGYSLTDIQKILNEKGYDSILDIPNCNDFNEEILSKTF